MAQNDMAAYLRATTETAYNNLVSDLSAMDKDKAAATPHEALRPAIKLVAECGAVNGLLATLVATGEAAMPTPEDSAAFYAGITTPEAALAALNEGTQKLYAAIDGTTPDTWDDTVPTPFISCTATPKCTGNSRFPAGVRDCRGHIHSAHVRFPSFDARFA